MQYCVLKHFGEFGEPMKSWHKVFNTKNPVLLKIIFITLQYCGLKHFGEFGESMKSWLCQNPEQRAVNNVVVDAYKKILK